MSDGYHYIVEHLEVGEMDEFTRSTRLAAMLIDHDRHSAQGQYREESVLRCPECLNAGREPRAIARTYVAPGGERLIYFPARLRSGGPTGAGAATVPATARNFPTLATGLDFTQCRACQTYFVVTAEQADKGQVHVIPVDSSTFGAVDGDGAPTVVHQVKVHPVLTRMIARHAE